MAGPFTSEAAFFEFDEEFSKSSRPQREELAYRVGVAMCYHDGIQWINDSYVSRQITEGVVRYRPNLNPDKNKLRVVQNETTFFVQQSASATRPEAIYMDVYPPEADAGPEPHVVATVHEQAMNAGIDDCRLLTQCRRANYRRCVVGTWGLGLTFQIGSVGIDGSDTPDLRMRVFNFDPTCLITDPAVQEPDLIDHDSVGYEDVWAVKAIVETFPALVGMGFREEDCKTFQQLEPIKHELGNLSEKRIFAKFVQYSTTKAARVKQYHCRAPGGFFQHWYVVVEDGNGKKFWVNRDDPESPFGLGGTAKGLPLMLLHGHARADSMWSWGDVDQIRDDQDMKNMARTLYWRIVQRHAGNIWVADRRFWGKQSTDADIRQQLTNQVFGSLIGELRDRVSNVAAPQLLQIPPPPPFIENLDAGISDRMRMKSNRAPGHLGELKSHTDQQTNLRAMEAADQPLGVRVSNDIEVYESLVGLMHSTNIKLMAKRNPSTLAMVGAVGFDEMEFSVLAQADPDRLPYFRIRESSVRYRSHNATKADIEFAVVNGQMTTDQYHAAMAETLDTPLNSGYRQMQSEARKAAAAVVSGMEWEPKPLGDWTGLFIKQFNMGMVSKAAKRDPQVVARLTRALQAQYDMWGQEKILADPSLAAQAQAQPQQPTEGAMPGMMNPADALDMFASQDGSATSQIPALA